MFFTPVKVDFRKFLLIFRKLFVFILKNSTLKKLLQEHLKDFQLFFRYNIWQY
jgi:hypothetical protein